ncbi:hypothetical protein [Achromobacter phage Motura]|uniref:Uncharacterized protein n=1 Tax=Achromobacter phage Motura TaxID=2591403 RepID=A0A514CT22_9CAUD|nr:hypothetical protein H1O15_gp173 [Achromobacter phage Motura]QDH83615.1 hypothetical protein [Achromobacter phage Motura]
MDYEVSITPAKKPRNSLVVSVGVQQGYNQIRQRVGDYSQAYLSETSIQNSIFELAPNQVWTGASSNMLIVRCDGPISVEYTRKLDDTQVTIYVKNLLVLDELTTNFIVKNVSTVPVKLFVHQALGDSLDRPVVPPSTNPVLSVNGQSPDTLGNVTVDTGVMTIDGVQPTPQGDIQMNEGQYS